jgi:hypothetical protein
MAKSPSAWLPDFVEAVGDCMEAQSTTTGPVGWRYHEEDLVDLVIDATPMERLGGEYDGTIVLPGFSLDVQVFQRLFERATVLNWYAQGLGPKDHEDACISIEGVYCGHAMWLWVLAEAPEDEEPGLQLDTSASP